MQARAVSPQDGMGSTAHLHQRRPCQEDGPIPANLARRLTCFTPGVSTACRYIVHTLYTQQETPLDQPSPTATT